ncbi:MAG: RNA polymerase sigma factor [Chitinophagaceae bacterium]
MTSVKYHGFFCNILNDDSSADQVTNNTDNNFTDQFLVTKVLSGHVNMFGIIIKQTERLVTQIVFKMIPVAEDRKDIAQDIYLKAFDKLGGFKFGSKLSTWIARIAYNSCLDFLAKKKLILPGDWNGDASSDEIGSGYINSKSPQIVNDEFEKTLNRKELQAILKIEIEKLPPVYKTIITLYHNEGLSYQEIEQITSLPGGTIKSYLFRARKLLKESLLFKYKKEEL